MRQLRIASPNRAAVAVAAVQLAIALPFLAVAPSTVRGVPGPLLIVVAMAASYSLGVRRGVALTLLAVGLGVVVIDESSVASPLVWLPASVGAGLIGEAARRGERLRLALITELRSGLVALSRDRTVGPVTVISRYLPAERAQLLAGDFYGVVRGPGGDVALMVGDVSGHGPDAAAVATHLRAAWRALAVAGVPAAETLRVLNDALVSEQRASGGTRFATVCLASIKPDLAGLTLAVAGHPPPLLVRPDRVEQIAVRRGPPLGVVDSFEWRASEQPLPDRHWSLLLYTDGLVEGRAAPDGPRPFGEGRLGALLSRFVPPLEEQQVDAMLAEIRASNGGPMTDDVVVLTASPLTPAAATGPLPALTGRSHRS